LVNFYEHWGTPESNLIKFVFYFFALSWRPASMGRNPWVYPIQT
jgi:hypothetical protein